MSSPTPLHPEVIAELADWSQELVVQHQHDQKIQVLLSHLGFALRSFNNLDQLLELVPFMACQVTDATAGVIVLYQDNQPQLEKFYCAQYPTLRELRNAFTVVGDQPIPLDADNNTWDIQLKEQLNPRLSLFSVPIMIKTTVRGHLWVLSQQEDYQWTEDRLTLLRLIADQTAIAIENEELTAELRRQAKLTRELDIGSEIQERLLPKTCPNIPGLAVAARCENALKVGGDYYDFIPILNTERWGLVLGDVMGKGVPAGLLMMMTRGTLRSEVLRQEPPAQILDHLNRVMFTDLENSNRFVTLFYAEYEPSTHRLSYSNAAHPRPIYWRAKTQELTTLEAAGTLIGLNADTTYPQETVYLESGDVVVCYTDGFTEAANGDGRYGEDKWTEQVAWAAQHYATPEAIIDYLYAQIRAFRGSRVRDQTVDDMTIMVLKAT